MGVCVLAPAQAAAEPLTAPVRAVTSKVWVSFRELKQLPSSQTPGRPPCPPEGSREL